MGRMQMYHIVQVPRARRSPRVIRLQPSNTTSQPSEVSLCCVTEIELTIGDMAARLAAEADGVQDSKLAVTLQAVWQLLLNSPGPGLLAVVPKERKGDCMDFP